MEINLPPSLTQGNVLNHKVTVTTASVQCLPITRNRMALRFHNPGTVDVFVCPAFDSTGTALPAVVNGAGNWLVMAGATIDIDAPGGEAWNCIAASSAVLTILEYSFFQGA
jgi:hypothetical protein